jgi:hypothetical protein
MRGTQAGFAILVKAGDEASRIFAARPEAHEIYEILEAFGISPLDATAEEIRIAQAIQRLRERLRAWSLRG